MEGWMDMEREGERERQRQRQRGRKRDRGVDYGSIQSQSGSFACNSIQFKSGPFN